MDRSEVVGRALDQHRAELEPQPGPNPALEEHQRKLEVTTEVLRRSTRAVVPAFDEAVRSLDAARQEHERIPISLRQLAPEVAPGSLAVIASKARDSAKADADRRAAAARQALEGARAEVLAELIPDPVRHADRDRAERELGDELALLGDTERGLRALAQRYLEAGDEYAVRVLAGSWGRRQHLRAGGSPESWKAIQREIYASIAKRATTPADKRRWSFVLSNEPDSLITILHHEAHRAVER